MTATDGLASAIAAFRIMGSDLVAAIEPLAARLPGFNPDFCPRIRALVCDLSVAAQELHGQSMAHAQAVAIGTAGIHRTAAPQSPPPPMPTGPLRTISVLQDCNADYAGAIRTVGKFCEADVPRAIAERALAVGLAIEPGSERAVKLVAGFAAGTTR